MAAKMKAPEQWEEWAPGVLGGQQLRDLSEAGWVHFVQEPADLASSSLDLHLGGEGWQLPFGSVKPMGKEYLKMLEGCGLTRPLDHEGGKYTLQPGSTYVFRIKERLSVEAISEHDIYGQATAKSSVGRMDVLARLIVDGMDRYEEFTPEGIRNAQGDIYLEITPITFSVQVKAKTPITQLRLFKGEPSKAKIAPADVSKLLLHSDHGASSLSVDLTPVLIGGLAASAFRAKNLRSLPPIPLWKQDPLTPPWEYWDIVAADKNNRLMIESGRFYILRSKEKICLPNDLAVYCRAINETIGEIRIHYAGFVHPGFGANRDDGEQGTPLIFEVRGHGINANLADGERLADLEFYTMSQPVAPDKSDYKQQTLKLSGFFASWPDKLQVDIHDISVVPLKDEAALTIPAHANVQSKDAAALASEEVADGKEEE